jgi:hypothetical protein
LLQFPAPQKPYWCTVRNECYRSRNKGFVPDKNATIYIVPVKAWTWRYALIPEVLRLRAITSALAKKVSNAREEHESGRSSVTYNVAGSTRTSQ